MAISLKPERNTEAVTALFPPSLSKKLNEYGGEEVKRSAKLRYITEIFFSLGLDSIQLIDGKNDIFSKIQAIVAEANSNVAE